MTLRKNAHCSYCGERFAETRPWPRQCAKCQHITYLNPLPVTVALLPVDGGLLCIRRSIEPALGQVALPGGFMDVGETWQEAAARELWEEAGVTIAARELELFAAYSSRNDPYLLIFGLARERTASSLPPYEVTNETSERLILREPVELAFPLHTRAMREFFAGRRRGRAVPG